MIKMQIEMPSSAGSHGMQIVELPSIPRIGEVIKDANNRYYLVEAVTYQPFERKDVPNVLVDVSKTYASSAIAAISKTEKFER